MRSAKTRIFVFLTLVILTAVFSASALTANQTANTETAAPQESGFIASSFNSILSFFGLSDDKASTRGDDKNSCDTAREGLIACYRGDNSTADARGVHNGEWVGELGYATGKVGAGAFSFNGKGQIQVANDLELNPANLTVDGWVNLSSKEGTFNLVAKGEAYALRVRGGVVEFVTRNAKGEVEILSASRNFDTGTWVHIAGTHDGKVKMLYIDGKEVGTVKQEGLFGADETGLVIGSTENKGDIFTGLADEVKLFNRALSEKEIKDIAGERPGAVENFDPVALNPVNVPEANTIVTISLNRTCPGLSCAFATSANFTLVGSGGVPATIGASCAPGIDAVLSPDSLTWVAFETGTKNTSMQICEDGLAEGTEGFTVSATVTGPEPNPASANGTILDNDTVSLGTAPTDVPEGTGGAGVPRTFTVDRGAPGGNPGPAFGVGFTLSGTAQSGPGDANSAQDYTVSTGPNCTLTFAPAAGPGNRTGTITFNANSTDQTCPVIITPVTDDFVENDESVTLTVTTLPGNPAAQTFNITNDDNPDISIAVSAAQNDGGRQYVEEGNPQAGGTLTYTLTRGLCPAASPGNPGGPGTGICVGGDTTALAANQDINVTFSGTARNSPTGAVAATDPVDYTPAGTQTYTATTGVGSVRFTAAGSTSASTTVNPDDDIVVEIDETVTVTVNAGAGYDQDTTPVGGVPAQAANIATGFINDDDEDVSVVVTGSPVTENGGVPLVYTLTRNALSNGANAVNGINPIADPLRVNFTLAGAADQAECDFSDYLLSPGVGTVAVGFAAGACPGGGFVDIAGSDTDGILVVTPVNDAVPENHENVLFTITAGTGGNSYGIGSPNGAPGAGSGTPAPTATNVTANGQILNDDIWVNVQIYAPNTASVNEGSIAQPDPSDLVYTFTRVGATSAVTCVNYNVSSGGNHATLGTDYTFTFGTATACPNSLTDGSPGSHPGVIGIPTGPGNPATAPIPPFAALVAGVEANQNTLIVDATDDDTVEGDETVQVNVLTNALNPNLYQIVAPDIVLGTILNDDGSTVSVTGGTNGAEGTGATLGVNQYFTLSRNPTIPVNVDLTVNYTLNAPSFAGAEAADYNLEVGNPGGGAVSCTNVTNGSAVIPTGTATCTIRVNPVEDSAVEPDETVTLTLAAGSYIIAGGGGNTANVVINNDDNSVVSVAPVAAFANEGDAAGNAVSYNFTRTSFFNPPNADSGTPELGDLTIRFSLDLVNSTATCGTDYTLTSPAGTGYTCAGNVGTLTFTGTNTSVILTFTTTPELTREADETIIVNVAAGLNTNNGNRYAVGTTPASSFINNDDEDVVVTLGAPTTVSEDGGTNLVYTLTRLGDVLNLGGGNSTDDAISVDYLLTGAATNGTDYTVDNPSPLAFAGGQLSRTVTIDPTVDGIPENDEDVILTVVAGPNGLSRPESADTVSVYNAGNTAVGGVGAAAQTGIIGNDDFWVSVQVSPNSVFEGGPTANNDTLVYTFTRIGQMAANSWLCVNFSVAGGGNNATPNGFAGSDYPAPAFSVAAGDTCPTGFNPVNPGSSTGIVGIRGGAGNPASAASPPFPPVVAGVQTNQRTLSFSPNDDTDVEGDEVISVRVENDNQVDGFNYSPSTPSQADGTILDDDSVRVAVTLQSGSPANEGSPATGAAAALPSGGLVYRFTRTNGSNANPLVVNFRVNGAGTVAATADDLAGTYAFGAVGPVNSVTIPAGQGFVDITINPNPDIVVEGDETVRVSVESTSDYIALGDPADGVIRNDDNTVSCSITGNVNEGTGAPTNTAAGVITVTCTRTTDGAQAGQNLTIAVTRSTGDYQSPATTLTFNGGTVSNGLPAETAQSSVSFTANVDSIPEADETVSYTVTNQVVGSNGVYVAGGSQTVTSTFLNDDNTVTVAVQNVLADGTTTSSTPSNTSVFESSSNLLRYRFNRSTFGAEIGRNLAVNFRVNGGTVVGTMACSSANNCVGSGTSNADFALRDTPGAGDTPAGVLSNWTPVTTAYGEEGTVNFLANAPNSFVDIFVDPNADDIVEPDETVTVTIIDGARYVAGNSATGTIVNDDNTFSVAAVPNIGNEGNSNTDPDNINQENLHGRVPEAHNLTAPTVNASNLNTDLTPHGSHAVFVVTRTGNLSSSLTIDIGTIPTGSFGSGTATSGPQNSACGAPGVDYITDGETFTFPAVANTFGTQTAYHFVAVCGDKDVEINETINVKLSNPAILTSPVSPASLSTSIPTPVAGPHATYTIRNDDGNSQKAGVFVRPTNVKVVEPGAGGTVVANFQVCAYTSPTGSTIATNLATPIFFDYITTDGGQVVAGVPSAGQTGNSNVANSGSDYGATSSNLTDDDIAIDATTGCSPLIPVTVSADALVEGQENYFLWVFNVNPGTGNSFGAASPNVANALDTRTTGSAASGFQDDVLNPGNLFVDFGNGLQLVQNAVASVGLINETGSANSYFVTDVAQAEGNGGDSATTFVHFLRKNGTAQESQTVCWRTQNGNTAVTGGGQNPAFGGSTASGVFDYTIVNPSNISCHTFDANTPDGFSLPINIVVNGDQFYEKDDTYTVELISISPNTVGSTFAANPSHPNDPNYVGKGIGTIQNDDLVPTVGIVNVGTSDNRTTVENDSNTFNIPVRFEVRGGTLIPVTVAFDVAGGGFPSSNVVAVVGPDGPVPNTNTSTASSNVPNPNTPAGACGPQTASTAIDLYQPNNGGRSDQNFPFSPVTFTTTNLITKAVTGVDRSFIGQNLAGSNYFVNLIGCGDVRPETDENFTVTITSAVEALVAGTGATTSNSTQCDTRGTATNATPAANALCGNKVGIIRDNDWNGVFNFSDANGLPPINVSLNDGDVSLAEGSTLGGTTNFDFYVRYTGRPADYAITMTLQTVDGTAQDDLPTSDDNDYVPRNNLTNPTSVCTVTFPAGSNAPQLCRVVVNHDAVQEIDETFTLQVTNISTPLGTVTVSGNDNASGNIIGYGPGGAKGIPVVYNTAYGTQNNPAAFGTDLIAQGNILNDDGSRVVSVNSFKVIEGTSSSTTSAVHRVEIQGTSNQAAVFTYRLVPPTTANGLTAGLGDSCTGADTGTPDVIRTPQLAPLPGGGSYPAGTGLTASTATTGTLTFGPTGGTGPGFEFIDILVPVCADNRDESGPSETYRIELTAVSNVTVSTGSGNGLGTINDDDGVQYSLLTNPINIQEGDTLGAGQSATVTLVRSGNSINNATFTWYTVNGPAPIPPGLAGSTGANGGAACNTAAPQTGDPDFIAQGSQAAPLTGTAFNNANGFLGNRTLQVPICGDTVQEGNQSFTVVITPSDGAPLTATVNIVEETTDVAVAPQRIEGDVVGANGESTGDNAVLANDVSALRAALLAGTQPFSTSNGQFSAADINSPCGNGGLDVGDLAFMRQLALNMVPGAPFALCGPSAPTTTEPADVDRAENVRVIRVVNSKVAITPGTPPPATVTFPIEMVSTGIETGASFSISWDITRFTYNTSAVGNGVPGQTQFDPITTQTGQGRLGMFINSPNSFVAGTRQLATITLNVLPTVTAGTYPVTFGGQPTAIFVSGVNGADVTGTTTFEGGNIVVNTTAAGVRISGRVTNAAGQGIRNATVVMTDAEGNRVTATTGSFGIYTFEDVEVGSSYVITVDSKRYRFASRVLNVNDSLTDVNFVGQE